MVRWQYKTIRVLDWEEVEPALTKLGNEGWELVAADLKGIDMILKRPVESPNPYR
jgi:hypothetical protein